MRSLRSFSLCRSCRFCSWSRLRGLCRLCSLCLSFSRRSLSFGLRCSRSCRSSLSAFSLCAFSISLCLLPHSFVSLSSPFVRFGQAGVIAISQSEIRHSALIVLHFHTDLAGSHVSFGILLIFSQHGAIFTKSLFVLALSLKTGTLFNTGINSPRLRHSQQKCKRNKRQFLVHSKKNSKTH